MAKTVIPRFTLVAPSADGTCCPCSALSDPCTCAGLVPIVRCRTRGALAEMIGFHAFTDPADPPDTYLVGSMSGSSDGYVCPNTWMTTHLRAGSDVWDTDSGALHRGCTRTVVGDGAGVFPEDFWSAVRKSECRFTTSVSPTTWSWTGTGVCCSTNTRHTGGWTASLSTPCTEQQALYRATAGLKWSDWAVLTELPGCSALWELRSGTEDYDFAVRESEYQLEFPALTITEQATDPITGEPLWITPGVPLTTTRQLTAQVEVRVDINRRPWNGGSPWMLYRTDTFGPMTITGGQTFEGVVPNDRGYETIITNVRYRVVG